MEFDLNSGRLQVHGHTDQAGSEQYNPQLSINRPQSVANFIKRHSQKNLSVEIHGFGESQPLVLGSTTEECISDRRVEICISHIYD
ncbi:MAG: OmpA family protein [Gammaproteobacteria bacterium]|nr:OmpA family protein [Gammaproteobacteria bacterium]